MATADNAVFTRQIIAREVLKELPMYLIDVGCSGGIPKSWKRFAPDFKVVAFDPNMDEIERLRRLNGDDAITYVCAFVGKNAMDRRPLSIYQRISARLAMTLTASSASPAYRLAGEVFQLDDYFSENRARIDFIKIDTDGSDYEVLSGAAKLLAGDHLLGIEVESHFQHDDPQEKNTFGHIDILLKESGFSLFALKPRTDITPLEQEL